MRYLISHTDTCIQISFSFKAFLMNNGTHTNITEKTQESVLNWFCEYAYFAIDKYSLSNFRITPLMFPNENFSVSFEIKTSTTNKDLHELKKSLSLFTITEIIKMILKPDPKKEFPLLLDDTEYHPIGYIPEY
jgi:hypothetical protein